MKQLTYEEAHKLFRYDPENGKLFWRVSRGSRAAAGSEAGYLARRGQTQYWQIKVNGKNYYRHRVIWLMRHGKWPKHGIDHRDGNGLAS